MQKAALVETHQTASVSANQNPPSKSLVSSFSQSFISSGKQGGGTTVLREGCDTVTRETCSCFSELKQLRKSTCIASAAGVVTNSACGLLGTAVLMSSSHRFLIIHSSQFKKV
jgi:hypothetical protein